MEARKSGTSCFFLSIPIYYRYYDSKRKLTYFVDFVPILFLFINEPHGHLSIIICSMYILCILAILLFLLLASNYVYS